MLCLVILDVGVLIGTLSALQWRHIENACTLDRSVAEHPAAALIHCGLLIGPLADVVAGWRRLLDAGVVHGSGNRAIARQEFGDAIVDVSEIPWSGPFLLLAIRTFAAACAIGFLL